MNHGQVATILSAALLLSAAAEACAPSARKPSPPPVPEASAPSHQAVSSAEGERLAMPPQAPPAVVSSAPHRSQPPALRELPVPGHGPATLALPRDRGVARPVLLAAHGAGDTPVWQCRIWSEIIDGRGFVLCPRGTRMSWGEPGEDLGFFFRDHRALEREVLAAVEALAAAYPGEADVRRAVYTGYSQGATMGALMVVQHASRFPRLILVEGGEREWDVPTATRYREGGGARVLFACGRSTCAEPARQSVAWIRKGGVDGRLEVVPRAGHTYGGPVAERLRGVFAWVVEGDDRW